MVHSNTHKSKYRSLGHTMCNAHVHHAYISPMCVTTCTTLCSKNTTSGQGFRMEISAFRWYKMSWQKLFIVQLWHLETYFAAVLALMSPATSLLRRSCGVLVCWTRSATNWASDSFNCGIICQEDNNIYRFWVVDVLGTYFFWPAEIMAAQKLQSFWKIPFQVINGSNVQCMCLELPLLHRGEKVS